jgi:hypothetical protein
MTKLCHKCGETKDSSEFYPKGKKLRCSCKLCEKLTRSANSNYFKKYRVKYRLEHPDYFKNYYNKNKSILSTKAAERHLSNKLHNNIRSKNWVAANKDRHASTTKAYKYKRMRTDALYKTAQIIRSNINTAFIKNGHSKNIRTEKILGCSFDEFKTYIESKFTKGMCWENHGEWHLDHCIPLSTAKTIKRLLELNYFTNFQPLWATSKIAEKYGEVNYIGNLEKGSKIMNKQLTTIQ